MSKVKLSLHNAIYIDEKTLNYEHVDLQMKSSLEINYN